MTLPSEGETPQSASTQTTASSSTDILGSILGAIGVSTGSIIGTWVYQEPSVQFTSDNLLAKAGGTVASAKVVQQLDPYYQKVGIKPGKMTITLNADNTCSWTIGAKKYSGTYSFDRSAGTLEIQSTVFAFPTAYVTTNASNLSLTFDSTKILQIVQGAKALSTSGSTLSTISSIASAYDGMKTGFLFRK
jgi:hypothetical protein